MKFLGLLLSSALAQDAADAQAFETQETGKVAISNFQCDGAFVMSMDLVYTPGAGRSDTVPGNFGCINTKGDEHDGTARGGAGFNYENNHLTLNPYPCARNGLDEPDNALPLAASTEFGSDWNTGDFKITWNAQFKIPGTNQFVHVARYNIPVSCTYPDSFSVTADTAVTQKTSTTAAQAFALKDSDFELTLDSNDQAFADSYRANDQLTATVTAKDDYLKLSSSMEFAPIQCQVTAGPENKDLPRTATVELYNIDGLQGSPTVTNCGLSDLGWSLSKSDRADNAGSANVWNFSYITFVMGEDLHEDKHTYELACTIKVCNNANTGSDCSKAEGCTN